MTEDTAPPGGLVQVLRALVDGPLAILSTVVFALLLFTALFAPLIAPQDPYDLAMLDLANSRLAPGALDESGARHVLGTDDQGRDMLSAILYGLRISIGVGLVSTLVAMTLGTLLGAVAGYRGGRLDTAIMRVVDIQLSIPAILVALILLAIAGRGIDNIILALVAVQWVYFARTARGAILVERRMEYVIALQMLGFSHRTILLRHIIPNIAPALSVVAMVEFASAIALEATLSFLGIGLPVTEPSLGLLIANGFAYLLNDEYWISIYPGIALLLVVFSINVLGDRLRDTMNPRQLS